MRVAQVARFGGPEVLVTGQVPDPEPGPGQVVVNVAVADTLYLDAQLRSGWGREYWDLQPPYVPGNGVAGEVRTAGKGVATGWLGQKVVAMTESGGYAEQAVTSAERLVPVPDGLDLREAAALLQTGPAALRLVDVAEIKPDDRVLVTAAGGGLGTLLVQLAAAAGARVVAAAGNARKLELARELGATATVDYSQAGWPDRVRAATGDTGVAVTFDGVGGQVGQDAFEVTGHGGRFFAYGVPSGSFAEADPEEAERREVTVHGIEQVQFAPEEAAQLTGRILAEAAAGKVRPVIGQTFPLERAADAHAAIEFRNVTGKALLLV